MKSHEQSTQILTPDRVLEPEHTIEDFLIPERNCIIVEDWFRQIEWSGKLAAILLFKLLTSDSERYRGIGQYILKDLCENVYEPDCLTSEMDMFVREILYAILEHKSL